MKLLCRSDSIFLVQQEHDINLRRFLEVAKEAHLTFNYDKCILSTDSIDLLGYRINKGVLQPDPNRFEPVMQLPVPNDLKSMKRALGMFAYYPQWISK